MRYILQHWRGSHTLGRSFWINSVGVNVLFKALGFGAAILADRVPFGLAIATGVLIWLAIPPVLTWQIVGVVRSAANYTRATGNSLLPGLAYGAVGVIFLSSAFAFISTASGGANVG